MFFKYRFISDFSLFGFHSSGCDWGGDCGGLVRIGFLCKGLDSSDMLGFCELFERRNSMVQGRVAVFEILFVYFVEKV